MKSLYPGKLIRIPLCMAVLSGVIQASAQKYYPGGIGNGNLVIWLNANKSSSITMNGSNQVSSWGDLSGNAYNFSQATTSNEPVYNATAGPNSRPALTFASASSQYLSTASLPATISFTGGVTSFVQASFGTSSAWGYQRVFDFGSGQANNNICFGRYGSSANLYYEGWNGTTGDQTYTTSGPIVTGTSNIYETVQQSGSVGTTTTVSHYLAGTSQANSGAVGSSKTWIPTAVARASNYVGRSNWAVDDYFNGTMSEILIYKSAFTTTQRVIVENYLAAEWGNSVSVTKYTPPTSTTYNQNLVGIGYTSPTDYFVSDVAGSTDGLGFNSFTGASDFLNTAGYLMAAHNGQSATTITNAYIPGIGSATSISKWNRSWYVQKTGGNPTGVVTLKFNFNDYNGTAPSAANSYALLYNATDGTFAGAGNQLTTTTTTPTVSGNIVSFSVNVANLANGYYTIIYSASTLPVVLTGFTATKQDNTTLLKWSVTQESDIDRYEIQHGENTNDFSAIGSVAATNAGSMSTAYSFTDATPGAGKNYYRMKIVDRDGNSTYSEVVLVDFPETQSSAPAVYPNPVIDQLHIDLTNVDNGASVLLLNAAGQKVKSVSSSVAGRVDIPVGDLSKGVYFVEIKTATAKYVRKIMKN